MYTPTKTGDTVKILQLLSLGYSPIQKFAEAENGTPLHVAASEGHVLTSHILVQAGAELDAIGKIYDEIFFTSQRWRYCQC
jgi:hypothetical protein